MPVERLQDSLRRAAGRYWRRKGRTRRVVLSALAVFLLVVAWSIAGALLAPGTDPVSARLAEWGRDHGLGPAITWLENQQYQRNEPSVGGTLSADQRSQLTGGATAGAGAGLPAPITPLATPPLPGEGTWRVLDTGPAGPTILRAVLRPDPGHTSYLAYVAWIRASAVRFVLHPGLVEPGHSPWRQTTSLTPAQRTGLLATFNGGFRLRDALASGGYGGYYAEGRTIGALKPGYAAEIFHADGSMTVGEWGRDATAADPTVVAVRENLRMLVDGGRVQSSLSDGSGRDWGYTVKNSYYVWRSGVGVTADGNIVYAMGAALSVQSLAELLRRAGAVRAMELDINPVWVSFMSYRTGTGGDPTPVKLADFSRPADRYYHPSTRDFVAVYAR